MQIETDNYKFEVFPDGSVALALACGLVYRQNPPKYAVSNLQNEGDSISFDLTQGVFAVHARYVAVSSNEISLELEAEGAMNCDFEYPAPWKPHEGDRAIIPMDEGLAMPVDGTEVTRYLPDNGNMTFFPRYGFFALLNSNVCLANAVECTSDAMLNIANNSDGRIVTYIRWLPSKGKMGYVRRILYFINSSLTEAALHYRAWREKQKEFICTLSEKAKRNPNVKRLFGAADFWIWDDNNMNRLYARPESSDITPREPRRVANEMLQRGMTRVLWNSFEGESPEDCQCLKELGFLVGKYDIYRDVLPKPLVDVAVPYRRDRSVNTRHWPEIVRIEPDGSYAKAWQIHGKDGKFYDQHAVCDMCALRLTMENVPPDVARVGYNSRLIDVQAGSSPRECYAPLHSTTRKDSIRYINMQNRFLDDMGLVVGVEVGQEACVNAYHYAEGMMSLDYFRAYESGRRMCTQYKGDEIPPVFLDVMLNARFRIPLWELLYHDCAVATWYWGDASNSSPDLMPLRDLFDALYGVAPLYSLNMTQWDKMKDEIAASYHRATKVASLTATARMISFEWLTKDLLVQETNFDNGVSVIANFSSEPYKAACGEFTVQPASAHVRTANGSFVIDCTYGVKHN